MYGILWHLIVIGLVKSVICEPIDVYTMLVVTCIIMVGCLMHMPTGWNAALYIDMITNIALLCHVIMNECHQSGLAQQRHHPPEGLVFPLTR